MKPEPDNRDNKVESMMDSILESRTSDIFYYYEPWDPESPEDQALGFQRAYHVSTDRVRCANAANRTGKSLMEAVEAVAMMTGQVPYSMRYPVGTVTTIPRPWKDEGQNSPGILNRIRFGFKDPDTGQWSPPKKRSDMPDPGWPAEAPCGYVVGAGVFPAEKISHRNGDRAWVCTWKQVRDERWVPLLGSLIPRQFRDSRWNRQNGFSEKDSKFYLSNGNQIGIITYEMGWQRIQGANIWAIFYDEEPNDRRFWTEGDQRLIGAGTDGWMTLGFTPLGGLTWSYSDLHVPLRNGDMESASLYHATQYDSPFIGRNTINYRIRNNYKAWEIEARVYGRFSEMEGKPYYPYEKLNFWRRRFVRRFDAVHFMPNAEAPEMSEIYKHGAHMRPGEGADGFHWELYEKDAVTPDNTYFMSMDVAEYDEQYGGEDRDNSTAFVFRLPRAGEEQAWPVPVASCRTGMRTMNFARECAYAAMYFNYCLVCPEVRGTAGGELIGVMRDYPFIYRMVVVDDYTRKPKRKLGFDMNQRTRSPVFDMVGDFINDHLAFDSLKSWWLLKEASECIKGKKGRPDHPARGTTDSLVAFGIGLYIFRYNRDQVQNHYGWHTGDGEQRRRNDVFERYRDREPVKNRLGSKNWRRSRPAQRSYKI